MDSSLRLNDFLYDFPEHLVAHQPCSPRDHAKLLVRQSHGTLIHRHFHEIAELLPEKSLLVVNDTAVVPCRLRGTLPTGGKVEIFLTDPWTLGRPADEVCLRAIGRPFRKLKPGTSISLQGEPGFGCTISRQSLDSQELQVTFHTDAKTLQSYLEAGGFIPLPPYIKRQDEEAGAHSDDRDSYQTVYSNPKGSAAAPTAGLHFTDRVLQNLREHDIAMVPVTLHVGLGTFAPVRDQDLSRHNMHREIYQIPQPTADALQTAKNEARPVFFVGTTSLRAVESFLLKPHDQQIPDQWHHTDLFLYPEDKKNRYRPQLGTGMVTNFHQPGSTLIMLIASLLGWEETQKVYAAAIAEEYRLFSYGDSSLLYF